MLRLRGGRKRVVLPNGSPLQLLDSVSIDVEPGEILAIIGRSGAGKSTLLHCLGLMDDFDAGDYEVDGERVDGLSDARRSALRGRTFGFVFQQFYLFEGRTALANAMAPAQHGPWSELRQARPRAIELLERFGLGDRLDSPPALLSAGEQQRVAIARALIREPRYVLADEPTGSLDVETGAAVLRALIEACREGRRALVVVTHDEAVARLADRRYRLADGSLSRV
ncbi:MAG: lipoprotein-releasing system ATP-binding protein LolD 2 [Chloroflexota bacterium]|nr:MAG: lipoprotein-releasing system ATP-binding protein LolD 2 [Chloroflexota bacterium]